MYEQHIQGATGTAWSDLDVRIRDVLVDLQYRGDFRRLSVGNAVPGFDQFTQDFRSAASTNDVAAMCRVMADDNWVKAVYPSGSTKIWGVPERRFNARRESLGYDSVRNACP